MKKALLFSLTLMFIIGCNNDDDGSGSINTYLGDVNLRTQQEVIEFGSKGYTHIEGKICIGCIEQNDINDLRPLRNLKSVETLQIQNNTVLIYLDGLENLTQVDNLLIIKNPLLNNLDSFNGLTTINTIEIDDNNELRDIDGLFNLTEIQEHIKLSNTWAIDLNLENVTVLGDIELITTSFQTITIGATSVGTFTLENCFAISHLNIANIEEMDHFNLIHNQNLASINLETLQKINGTFTIVGNWALSSLSADNLTSLNKLHIQNTSLTNVNLENLQTPSEPVSINIILNSQLSDLNLSNITKASNVNITGTQLQNLNLPSLTTVEGDFFLRGNNSITTLSLNNLTELNGYTFIESNLVLEVIEANSLNKAEELDIFNHNQFTTLLLPSLSSLKTLILRNSRISTLNLEGLQNRPEPTSFFITDNKFLTSTNFGAMTIAKEVWFERNQGLTDLPLSNLTKIEEKLHVVNCHNIVTANIGNLAEAGSIFLRHNPYLETINANNLTQIGTLDIDGSNHRIATINMNNLGVVTERLWITNLGLSAHLINLDGFTSLYSVEALRITNVIRLRDFCGITNLITNGYVGSYLVAANGYNPTQQNIIDGNCSN